MKAKNKIYPAVFQKGEDGYTVIFPDLPGCITCGETAEQAFLMAREALALWLDDAEEVVPTALEDVKVGENETVQLVDAADDSDIVYLQQNKVMQCIEGGLSRMNFSKADLAKILDVDRSFITHIEKGKRKPSASLAQRIALLLGFDWKIFFDSQVTQ